MPDAGEGDVLPLIDQLEDESTAENTLGTTPIRYEDFAAGREQVINCSNPTFTAIGKAMNNGLLGHICKPGDITRTTGNPRQGKKSKAFLDSFQDDWGGMPYNLAAGLWGDGDPQRYLKWRLDVSEISRDSGKYASFFSSQRDYTTKPTFKDAIQIPKSSVASAQYIACQDMVTEKVYMINLNSLPYHQTPANYEWVDPMEKQMFINWSIFQLSRRSNALSHWVLGKAAQREDSFSIEQFYPSTINVHHKKDLESLRHFLDSAD